MGDGGCLPHLEWDPLVLPGLTEGMGEEKHIIYSNSQSQKWKHLWHTPTNLMSSCMILPQRFAILGVATSAYYYRYTPMQYFSNSGAKVN